MKIFLTSDHHFFHKNIISYENRPFANVDEMNETMIEAWNSTVFFGDIVYHLGDFGLGTVSDLRDVFERLNGTKILLLGNHDPSLNKCYEIGFSSVIEVASFPYKQFDIYLGHLPVYNENVADYVRTFHGHIHGKQKRIGNNIHVGVDAWDYKPVCLDSLLKIKQDEKIIVREHENRSY